MTKRKKKKFAFLSGQSIIEIIIALVIGVILLGAASASVVLILKNSLKSKDVQIAASLAQELIDNVRVISEGDWNNVYNLSLKGQNSQYYINNAVREITNGTENLTIGEKNFTRYFSIENVNRDVCGAGNITNAPTDACVAGTGILEDPSSQKIAVKVERNGDVLANITQYLTRYGNNIFNQTDWSGGPITDEIIIIPNNKFATSTNIDYTTAGSIILVAGQTNGNLTSSIFNTSSTAVFNAIVWQGNLGDGAVKFQIASSNTIDSWFYLGPDGTENSYYGQSSLPDASIKITPIFHKNNRYVRYKAFLTKTSDSPRIDALIINWSP